MTLSQKIRDAHQQHIRKTERSREKLSLWLLRHSPTFFVDATQRFQARTFISDRGERISLAQLHSWERRGWIENVLTELCSSGARYHYEVTDKGREVAA